MRNIPPDSPAVPSASSILWRAPGRVDRVPPSLAVVVKVIPWALQRTVASPSRGAAVGTSKRPSTSTRPSTAGHSPAPATARSNGSRRSPATLATVTSAFPVSRPSWASPWEATSPAPATTTRPSQPSAPPPRARRSTVPATFQLGPTVRLSTSTAPPSRYTRRPWIAPGAIASPPSGKYRGSGRVRVMRFASSPWSATSTSPCSTSYRSPVAVRTVILASVSVTRGRRRGRTTGSVSGSVGPRPNSTKALSPWASTLSMPPRPSPPTRRHGCTRTVP